MDKHITDTLTEFNRIYKKMDMLYHSYAKKIGISNMELWLLYSLYENDSAYTQKDFCSEWHYPPQTVNSTLKTLEKRGIITLEQVAGNRKIKQIVLTENGNRLINQIILPLVTAEKKAFEGMRITEREKLVALTSKYTKLLHTETDKL